MEPLPCLVDLLARSLLRAPTKPRTSPMANAWFPPRDSPSRCAATAPSFSVPSRSCSRLSRRMKRCVALPGIERREDLRRIAQPLGAQADRVQCGRLQVGEVVIDLRQLASAACPARGSELLERRGELGLLRVVRVPPASPVRRRGRQARSRGGGTRRCQGRCAMHHGRRAGGVRSQRAAAAAAAPRETHRRPRRRSRSRRRPSRASAPICAASAFRPRPPLPPRANSLRDRIP